jgi:MFS family permease
VAEHAPANKRGYCTSFIQATGMLGLLTSLLATLGIRTLLGEGAFGEYGWRIPFLLSIVLVVFSFLARRRMGESPIFARAKSAGQLSGNPVRESFGDPANRRLVLIALFGALNGQAVTWYTGHLYSLYFMQTVLHFQSAVATRIIVVALILTAPYYTLFGSLSDLIGRKKLIVTAAFCAGITYLPIYALMLRVGTVPNAEKIAGGVVPAGTTQVLFTGLILIQVTLATAAYAPTAAFLVEQFPTRIRYTSVSLPHHIANGIFGGLVPLIGTAMVAATGNKLAGVWFPTVMVLSSGVVGSIFIREKRNSELLTD